MNKDASDHASSRFKNQSVLVDGRINESENNAVSEARAAEKKTSALHRGATHPISGDLPCIVFASVR